MRLLTFTTVALVAFTFILSDNKLNAQDTISIDKNTYDFAESSLGSKRTRANLKQGSLTLPKGSYKSVDKHLSTIFNVNDSGFLHGEKKVFSGTRLQTLSRWNNGRCIREYVYSYDSGRLLEELFDSTATVFLFDSISNTWVSNLKTVQVSKQFSMVKGAETNWQLVFRGGPAGNYAIFSFRNGKPGGRNYINHFYEQYNENGEVVLQEVYNWKLKQREMISFTDTTKTIITNKNMIWNSDGTVSYLAAGKAGEDMQTIFYKSGKLIKKIVFKNNTRTEIEYDSKEKIKSKEVYKLPKVDNEMPPA